MKQFIKFILPPPPTHTHTNIKSIKLFTYKMQSKNFHTSDPPPIHTHTLMFTQDATTGSHRSKRDPGDPTAARRLSHRFGGSP